MDTIYYASRMNSGVAFTVGSDLVNSWLVYGILVALTNITKVDPFIILKIFAPLLYAGTCAGVYFVAWKRLKWNPKKCLLVSLIFSLQLASLAVSWQFYRNMLGVMVLLFAFPLLKNDASFKELTVLSVLAIFTVWGHELAMASLFFIVFGWVIVSALKKQKIPYKLFLAILPAILLFMGNFFWISPFAIPTESNIVRIDDSVWAHPGGLFFLTDYLTVQTPIETYSSYFQLASNVASLFLLLYGLMMPLIIIGYFKDRPFTIWTILLLITGLGCLVAPFFSVFLWARWMLLLIFPFSFYATNGLHKIVKNQNKNKLLNFIKQFKHAKKICILLILASMTMATIFMAWPLSDNNKGFINWGGTTKYVPSTMQTTSIPLQDIKGTQQAFNWLNNNMNNNSAVLIHDLFDNWAMLYLNTNHQAYLFDFNLENAANYTKNQGYNNLYFIWWNQNQTLHQLQIPNQWKPIQNYQRITIYQLN
ncbi:MAG: hypothetical protein NUK63_04435 [Candidatus Bathyarchaeum tardum]|nr:MAG: hypothetical protein NUK63_04435 [Candidatus Bathyarchaeum tardum]